MSEEEIKLKFEQFATLFEQKIFELISRFAEINDSFSRVQEGLDFLGKLRIQTAENKQLMSKVDQSFKNLERKLREMSIDGFQIPTVDEMAAATGSATGDEFDIFSAPATQKATTDKSDLSEFGSADELPGVDDLLTPNKEPPTPAPKPIKTPAKPEEPISKLPPTPAIASKKVDIEDPLETSTIPIKEAPIAPKSKRADIQETLEPPKMAIKEAPLAPVEPPTKGVKELKLPKIKPEEIAPPVPDPKIGIEESNLPPAPKFEEKELPRAPEPPKPVPPKSAPVLNEPKTEEQDFPPAPKPPAQSVPKMIPSDTIKKVEASQEKITTIAGPQDVWHNLTLEIKQASSNEQIALSLGLANDHLKKFIRFHKVLFELLKMASQFRKAGAELRPSDSDRDILIKQVESWKFELR